MVRYLRVGRPEWVWRIRTFRAGKGRGWPSLTNGCVIVPGTESRVEKYGIDERDITQRRKIMPASFVADATIHDMEKHRTVFLPAVDALIAKMGAKILARTSNPIYL